ncbi:MAPK/MAK/MRK overlapping kinase isoform X2 [Melopsittacus undulatus]|uniref:MAPK/MAK/MRK overlapping kinase isoform X2 n=1 Tax=Melopsittacus undulatus TaxID=13146 RepID=UPI00146A9F7D|nr:MAPK/MAK/MRK overlapping kinase isoform X2 [Melopsittacus undulatus]
MSPLEHSSAGTEACIHRSLYKQRAQLHRPKAARPAGGGEEPLHTSTEHAKAEVPRQGSRARQLPSTEQRRCIHPAAQFPASFLDLVSWTKFQKSTMLQAFWLTKLSTSSSSQESQGLVSPLKKEKECFLLCSLPPKGFSLLYAMIKYDPDERIAAHQALQLIFKNSGK